jgi:hypothetical protein
MASRNDCKLPGSVCTLVILLLLLSQLTSTRDVVISDVQPLSGRLVLFWSDKRVPHEVLPTHTDRYCVTVWFFDKEERAKAEAEAAVECVPLCSVCCVQSVRRFCVCCGEGALLTKRASGRK